MGTHTLRRGLYYCWSTIWLMLWIPGAAAQVKVSTVVGGYVTNGKPALSSTLQEPTDAAFDAKGNLYITDGVSQRIRELTTGGVLKTIAGTGVAGYNGDGGLAAKAMVNFPRGIVVDAAGNIIFCDAGNNRIRKIAPNKIITTIAGTGVAGYSGNSGLATAAKISSPVGLSQDSAGNLYFGDAGNNRIREIDTAGKIHLLAGNGVAGFGGDGGKATAAMLNSPTSVISDNAGSLYIADHFNRRVRKVDTSGAITTFAGNGLGGCVGDKGPATSANLGVPSRVLLFGGFLYISSAGCSRVRAVQLSTNAIDTVAGSFPGFDGNGNIDANVMLDDPVGIFIDSAGTQGIIVDASNNQVRIATIATGLVEGLAGGYNGDGLASTKASLNRPESIAFDAAGNMYIADTYNHRIRKRTPAGIVTTFAGTGISGYSGDGGAAISGQLYFPYGVATDSSGNVYISDNGNAVIRKVDSTGKISTFAQNANFSDLLALTSDASGNLYAADDLACVIWKITPSATVSMAAGVLNTCGYNSDGITATTAQLNAPSGVAVDASGNLFISDFANNRLREVSGGLISTVAGKGVCGFSGDGGSATAAMICGPVGVTVDTKNNLYVGDYFNARVREVTAGTITTLAGTGNVGYNGNALAAPSTNIDGPAALTVFKNILYVADDGQYRVRKIH